MEQQTLVDEMTEALGAIYANALGWYETQTEMHPAHKDMFRMIARRSAVELRKTSSGQKLLRKDVEAKWSTEAR